MILVALLLLLTPAVVGSEPAQPSKAATIESVLHAVTAKGFVDRIEAYSEKFIGTPFEAAPLGEGPSARYDQGALFRFDAFDCTTFVETVTALALSRDSLDFPKWLQRIRYRKGKVSFFSRNHFPCGDWVPNNSSWGLLTDITQSLAGPLGTLDASVPQNKKEWAANLPKTVIRVPGLSVIQRDRRYDELQKEAQALKSQAVSLKYIPLEKLITRRAVAEDEGRRRKAEELALIQEIKPPGARRTDSVEDDFHSELVDLRLRYLIKDADVDTRFLAEIPSGSLMNIVRPNHSVLGTRLLISHQGLVIRKNGTPYFRHNSLSGGARTKDVPLANYLRLCLLSPAIHGIQVLRINDVRKGRK